MASSSEEPVNNYFDVCIVCGYQETGYFRTGYICPSCGAEVGFDDSTLAAVRAYRQQWLDKGALWDDERFVKDNIERLWKMMKSDAKKPGGEPLPKDKEAWIKEELESSKPPPNWNYKEQMKNIPPEWV